MKHYGDITQINGHNVPIVDIITGGSPCQDLSVAGQRAGLAGERSGLFMEQIRIIKEMRDECIKQLRMRGSDINIRHIKPRFMVWENVPGAFSSNKGEDFRCVLEEVCRVADKTASIPLPRGGSGQQVAVSWEIIGALLGEYTTRGFGESPSGERESHLSQILEERPHPKYSLSAKACQGILNRANRRGKKLPKILERALIRQSASKNELENQGGARDSSYNMTESEHCQHLITNQSYNPVTKTCNGVQKKADNRNYIVLEGNGSRPSHRGDGYKESDVAYTLNSTERHGVCQPITASKASFFTNTNNDGVAETLVATDYKDPQLVCYALDRASFNQGKNAQFDFSVQEEIAQTIVAKGPGATYRGQRTEDFGERHGNNS